MRHCLTAFGGFTAKGPACLLLEINSAGLLLDGAARTGLPCHGLRVQNRWMPS